MNIASWCIRHKVVTYALSAAMAAAGAVSYFKLGRLEDPEFTIKNAQIITQYPGATAKEVAEEVSDRIETAVQQMGQLKRVTSVSYPGKSIVMVEMKDKYGKDDLPQIWDELRRKVNDEQASLPKGCSTSRVVDDYGDVYGVYYAVYGDGYSYAELKEHAKLLRRELLLCQDVARVELIGDQPEMIYFEIPLTRLALSGITPAVLEDAISGHNDVAPAGHVEIGQKYVRIHPNGQIKTLDELGDILISPPGDTTLKVRLRDLATLSRGYLDPPQALLRYNGKPCIGLGISTVKGGNVVTMGHAIDKRLKELLAETPIGIEIGVISHQSSSVTVAVQGFIVNLIESVVIVIAVLLFAMGLRSGILIGAMLILTVFATIFVMDCMGILFERISLGAFIIALGMLVDNAIVITEAVLIAAEKGEDRQQAAINVVGQTIWPLLGATAVAVLSFAPIGASQDSTGEFCRSLFLVLLISLGLSWIIAITITPLIASWFIQAPKQKKGADAAADPYAGRFFRGYRAFLVFCIRHRWGTVGVLVLVLALAVRGFAFVKQNFFPDSTRPQFMVHVWMPQGTDIRSTDRAVTKIEEKIRELSGITGVTSMVGTGGLRFLLTYSPEDPDSAYGILFVDVKDYRLIDPLMTQIREYADREMHDAFVYSQKFVLGPGDAQKIQLRIIGPDTAILRRYADQELALFHSDPRLIEILTDWRDRVNLVRPVLSDSKARNLGVTRSDVAFALRRATDGIAIAALKEGDESIPIVVRPPAAERLNPDSIQNTWVWSSLLNCAVPLAQVVDRFDSVSEEAKIHRRNRLACITVKCNTTHETAATALARVMPKAEALLNDLPAGYHYEWGGEYESSANANEGLSGKIPPILLVMMLIVLSLFNSIRQPLVIFMTVPLVVIGITGGLLAFDQPFGFMALLGSLSLIGMQIKNAIVLIDEINAQLKTGIRPFDALVNAGVTRLRPVALSAITTVLGMLPLVTDAFYSAMAVTIMCGLTFATVLTMIVIPVNYALLYRCGEKQ